MTDITEMSQVTATQLPSIISTAIAADRPLMIHGSPGLGKSAAALQAAGDIGAKYNAPNVAMLSDIGRITNTSEYFGLFDVRLSQCDPVDVGGLPVADKERGVQGRLVPDWFPSTDRDDIPERGILLLEEAPSAPPAVQAAAYQLTHDRRIGNKVMKEGWSVVLTGNLLSDGGVVHKMPTPLANRLIHVYVRSDVDSWCDWALTHGIEPVVVGFIRFRPDLLNTFNEYVSKKQKGHAFATERSWEAASDLVKAVGNQGLAISDEELSEGSRKMGELSVMLAGTIGSGPAIEFNQFRKVWQEMPNIDGILMDPAKAPVPEKANTRYAVCAALAARASRDNFSTILQYAERLPKEFMMMVARDSTRRAPETMSTAAFNKFATQYHDLLV